MNIDTEISDLEEDILKEIINIGLAKVADSFAVMAKQPVMLNVPRIETVHTGDLNSVLPVSEENDAIIESNITGDLLAKALLIFSHAQVDKLAYHCIGPEAGFKGNYNAMKKSLVTETSNILTGALVTQFANIFGMKLVGMPPVAVPYRLREVFASHIGDLLLHNPIVITVKTHFLNSGKEVELPMVLIFDINSVKKIFTIIRDRNKADTNWLAHDN